MTEILGSDEPADRGSRRRAAPPTASLSPTFGPPPAPPPAPPPGDDPTAADLPIELLGPGWDDEPEPRAPGRTRQVLAALREPGSLAVASGFCLVASALAGPSYRFDAYPFNEGVSTLQSVFANSLRVRPLHDYLTAAAPNIALAVVAVLAALAALARGRDDQSGWVRPLAAGSLLAAVLVLALLGLGAYRTSTYDLTVQNPAGAGTTTG